jgi:hypothetical protein
MHEALGLIPSTTLKEEKKRKSCQPPVAHACNPSYLDSRDQEDHGSKPAWGNGSGDPILKTLNTKKDWWSDSSGRAPA